MRGYFSKSIIDFISTGNPDILSFGATSGTYTVMGILKGFELCGRNNGDIKREERYDN